MEAISGDQVAEHSVQRRIPQAVGGGALWQNVGDPEASQQAVFFSRGSNVAGGGIDSGDGVSDGVWWLRVPRWHRIRRW
ncbi:hypothetical protein COCNU_10G007650 [Cocos nucifera]|uniref:Uncharacterized protein n=1 Tax=Cocos nucifera TaxID=13894 RepID=A0A8K0N8L4_COCNU|nr:hypothetical protein COCNU_10G007650 [Cocos nucifera]